MSGFCPSPYKDAFPSMGEARKAVGGLKTRSKRGKSHSLPQQPYKCACGEYHLAYPKRKQAYDDAAARRRRGQW